MSCPNTSDDIQSSSSRADKLLWAPGYTMFSYRDVTSNGVQWWIANTSGTKRRVGSDLTFAHTTTHVQWAETDSSRFVYSGGINNGSNQVFVENMFSFSRDTLFEGIVRQNSIPRFSPDGQFIAYRTAFRDLNQPDVYTISRSNPDGTNTITLVDGKNARELVWSADGSHIIFISFTDESPPYTLYKVTSNGESLQTMVTHPIISSVHTIPGTRKIIYTVRQLGTQIKDGIYIMDIDDLSIQLVPNTESLSINGSIIDISPDGLFVCFGVGGNLFIVELATGIKTQITNDGISFFPTWSRW